jgi:hypothetical protein
LPVRIKNPTLASSASLAVLPPLEDYASQLDFEKITQAILGPEGTPKIPEYELEDIKNVIWTAAEKWLVRDIYDMDILSVEQEATTQLVFPGGLQQSYRGFIDVHGTLRGRLNVTKEFAGKQVVMDWKTTTSVLDADWDRRWLSSWQWKLYLYLTNSDVMMYRGIRRDGKTRELLITRPVNLEEDLLVQLQGVATLRQSLITSGLEIWPRKMPSACGSWGRECPHIADCQDLTMPRGIIPLEKSFSYSSMDKFLLCPERGRRSVFDESSSGDETEESLFGTASHRGLAELYNQAKLLFNNGL